MRYVDERLAVYDDDKLGYPSIGGCHAIGFLTTHGLHGYHNLGGELPERWGPMATKFAAFINGRLQPGETGLGIYGCAHATGQRGYPMNRKADAWKEELVGYASAIGWAGEIRGYDLTGFNQGGYDPTKSAYVEFRKVGIKCLIYVRQWRHGEALPGAPDGNFAPIALPKMPARVTSALTTGGGTLYNVDTVKLR